MTKRHTIFSAVTVTLVTYSDFTLTNSAFSERHLKKANNIYVTNRKASVAFILLRYVKFKPEILRKKCALSSHEIPIIK